MQTYYAKSLFVSKTFWFNVASIFLALLEAKDIIDVLPAGALKYVPAIVSAINIILRIGTVRPVAMVAPDEVKPVAVQSFYQTSDPRS